MLLLGLSFTYIECREYGLLTPLRLFRDALHAPAEHQNELANNGGNGYVNLTASDLPGGQPACSRDRRFQGYPGA